MLYSQQQQKILVQDRDNEVKNRNGTTIINCCFDIHHNKGYTMVWREPKATFRLSLINGFEIKLWLEPSDFTSLKTNSDVKNLSTVSNICLSC